MVTSARRCPRRRPTKNGDDVRPRLILVSILLGLSATAWITCVEWADREPTAVADVDAHALGTPTVQLADGRRVRAAFSPAGLDVQYQRTQNHPWSTPKTLFDKGGDAECPVSLSTYRNTVTVVAGWDADCFWETEGPDITVVAVSDGDLDDWDAHIGLGLEWDDVPPRYSLLGQRVVFHTSRRAGAEELSWRNTIGFTGETSPLSEDY